MKRFIPALFVMLLFGSCLNERREAAEYNDHIIDYQDRIIIAFDNLDSVLRDTLAEKQQVEYAYVNLQATVKHGLLVIDSIGPFRRDPIYQKATRELFSTYDDIVSIDYGKFIYLLGLPDSSYTQAHADSAILLRDRIKSQFEEATKKFIVAQQLFGKKYNIEFEQNP